MAMTMQNTGFKALPPSASRLRNVESRQNAGGIFQTTRRPLRVDTERFMHGRVKNWLHRTLKFEITDLASHVAESK